MAISAKIVFEQSKTTYRLKKTKNETRKDPSQSEFTRKEFIH